MDKTIHRVSYTHAVLEGTAHRVGRQQGARVARDPKALGFFTSGNRSPEKTRKAIAFFDRYCPRLNEEIQGFADELGVPLERVVYYALSYDPVPAAPSGACSQMVVMPSQSADGHLRVARSYEFSHRMSDRRLATTRIEGHAAHLGFSEMLFGRDDGMNEHGLCVTMSAGAPMAPVEPDGCMFWAMVRTVLDRCSTVAEALEVISEIPLSFNLNLMLADRAGHAALVEMASSRRAVKRAGEASVLVSTNHFAMPEMRPFDLGRRWNSVERHRLIRERLGRGGINADDLRMLLSRPFPEGLCGHDYTGFFGTLWSEVFDVTEGTAEICLGTPARNPWRAFDLREPAGTCEYPVELPEEPFDPRFWRQLEPGSDA